MKIKRPLIVSLISLSFLLVPLVAMRFTDEVNWNKPDFVIAGLLLIGIGLMVDLAIRTINKSKFRFTIYIAFIIALLLLWAEMGVGLFGSPIAGN